MIRIAVLDDYQQCALSLADWAGLGPACEIVSFPITFRTTAHAIEGLRDFEVVCAMRERTAFPRELFEALPDLRYVVTTGLRNAAIDMEAAEDCGVLISHTRAGATEFATSELTWALALAAMRKVALEDRRLREGHWQTTIGRTLHGKTLGLLGLGRVGTRVAAVGAAFGMNVIAWSPNLTDERARAGAADRVRQQELFERSDVLSLHMVLAPTTRGIVGATELAHVRPQAVLVNTSRAGLVDEAALIAALGQQRIAAAGLDVFEHEPLRTNHPFLRMDNVVLTPHLGYVTEETYRVFFEDVVENIAAYIAGTPLRVLAKAG